MIEENRSQLKILSSQNFSRDPASYFVFAKTKYTSAFDSHMEQ